MFIGLLYMESLHVCHTQPIIMLSYSINWIYLYTGTLDRAVLDIV